MKVNGHIQLYPFMRIVVALIIGIVVGDAYNSVEAVVAYGVASLLLAVACMFLWEKPVWQTCLLFLAVASVGAWHTSLFAKRQTVSFAEKAEQWKAVVVSRPVVKERSVSMDVVIVDGRMAERKVRVSLQRGTSSDGFCADSLRLGDGLAMWTLLKPIEPFGKQKEAYRFNYVRWMCAHGFVARAFVRDGCWAPMAVGKDGMTFMQRLRLNALLVREQLIGVLERCGMDDGARRVVTAMTLGDKTELGNDVKDDYSVSGASHLLALSGLHLGVIYLVLSFLLVRYPWKSVFGQAVAVAAIWFYVLLVGMPSSVVRAAVVITIYTTVLIMGRSRLPYNALAFTATCMLLINPWCLWDVGFQMSFVAVLSILIIFRPVYKIVPAKWLEQHGVVDRVWSLTVLSFAAQVGVAPLVLFYFGRFSCYFLLANYVAVPLATLVIYLTLALLLTSFLPFVPGLLGTVVSWLASLMNKALALIASWPGASIDNVHIGLVQLVLIYLFLGCMYVAVGKLWKVYVFVNYRLGPKR